MKEWLDEWLEKWLREWLAASPSLVLAVWLLTTSYIAQQSGIAHTSHFSHRPALRLVLGLRPWNVPDSASTTH